MNETMKRGLRVALGVLVIVLVMVLSVTSPARVEAASTPALPEMIGIGSYGVGSDAYTFLSFLLEEVTKRTGIKCRQMPASTDMGRLLPLRKAEVEFALVPGSTSWGVAHGALNFAAEDWGPQPIRTVWSGESNYCFAVRGNSDIHTLKDLKGKRVARTPSVRGVDLINVGFLAYAGLTVDDVVGIKVPSYVAAMNAVMDGAIDTTCFDPGAAIAVQMFSSPNGIRYLRMARDDRKAWAAAVSVCPWLKFAMCTRGAGISENNPVPMGGHAYPMICYRNRDSNLTYAITKAIWEGYDNYKGKHPSLRVSWSREMTLDYLGFSHGPYHDGSVKFFKEIGVWTPKLEEWQQKQVAREEGRLKAWPEAQKAAKEKGIKVGGGTDWEEFWYNWLKERDLVQRASLLAN